MLPSITFLLPVWNSASVSTKWLIKSLRSVLEQDYKGRIDLLVLNDGSTDDTVDVIKKAKLDLPPNRKFSVRTLPKVGITKALNIGLDLVESEYVARQDADDYSSLDRISKQINLIQEASLGLVGSAIRVVEHETLASVWNTLTTHGSLRRAFLDNNPIAHGSVLFRSDIIKVIGKYDESYIHSQDYDYFWRISRRYLIGQHPESLYYYRVHGNRVTSDKKRYRIQAECSNKIRERIKVEYEEDTRR